MESICNLIKRAKNFDKESMESLITRFDPIITSSLFFNILFISH